MKKAELQVSDANADLTCGGAPVGAPRASPEPFQVALDDNAPGLVVDRLEMRFGSFVAVRDVSFMVRRGEFLSLLGPSGSGKTTILRAVGGFEYPTRGRILLNGRDVQNYPAYRRNIGVVFQKYSLFPHLTAGENVEFPLRRRGIERTKRKQQVEAVLDLVGLRDLVGRYPTQLSGGQQQRVALARAIVFGPDILLLDEPLGALDKQLRERMQGEIRRLQQQLRITTIFVTHDQSEAMAMSDRIAVINHGSLEQVGTSAELYRSPRSEFVAGFIGDSNLIPCEVLEVRQGQARLRLVGGAFAETCAVSQPQEKSKLLLRPESINLSPRAEGAALSANEMAGTVSIATYLGDMTVYVVDVSSGSVRVKEISSDSAPRYQVGQPVRLSWDWRESALVSTSSRT